MTKLLEQLGKAAPSLEKIGAATLLEQLDRELVELDRSMRIAAGSENVAEEHV
jgi:hypothetical protein